MHGIVNAEFSDIPQNTHLLRPPPPKQSTYSTENRMIIFNQYLWLNGSCIIAFSFSTQPSLAFSGK